MKNPVSLKIAFTLTILFWSGFAFSQPVVRVAGSKDPEMIRQQAEMFLEHLDVQEDLYLTIIFSGSLSKKLKGYTVSDPSPDPDKYKNIRVMVDARLDKKKQMLVLAHEMIHVKQYAKNELKILNGTKVLWKERVYTASPGPNRFMPWEKEAHKEDLNLVVQLKSRQDRFQEVLAKKVLRNSSGTISICSSLSGKCPDKTLPEPFKNEISNINPALNL